MTGAPESPTCTPASRTSIRSESGAHGADQSPADRPGAGGDHRLGPALLRARPGPSRRTRPPGTRLRSACACCPRRSTAGIEARLGRMVEAGLVEEVRVLASPPRRHLAHGAPGARLPRGPGPRGGRCAPGRLPGGGGAPDPAVRPAPGLVVPPTRTAGQLGPGAAQRPRPCWTGPWQPCTAEPGQLREWSGCGPPSTRENGQRLPGRLGSRRRRQVLGGPGAPAGR